MFRFLKNIIVLIFLLSLPLLGKFYFSSPEERAAIINWLHAKLQPITETTQVVKQEIKKIDPVRVVEVLNDGEAFQQIVNCGKTKTQDLEEVKQAPVYRWVDDEGRVHFSDQAPGESRQSETMNVQYADRKRYFNLELTEDTASLPAFTRDKITADVRQIYGILARDLKVQHLRQVFLNLRIIENQADFQRYKNSVAPQIRTNSGFYTSKNNEAVVFQGDNPELMRSVIRHEASHVIMAGLYGVTPVWFNEGMAEYFEKMQLTGQARIVHPARYHLEHLQDLLRAEPELDLKAYMDQPVNDWYSGDLKKHYALAWSLVYYLMSSLEGKAALQAMMNQYAEDYCGGLLAANYFDQHWPGGVTALAEDWRRWVMYSEVLAHRY